MSPAFWRTSLCRMVAVPTKPRRFLGVSFLEGVLPLPKTGIRPEVIAGRTLAAIGCVTAVLGEDAFYQSIADVLKAYSSAG
jgi:hypothetical protein